MANEPIDVGRRELHPGQNLRYGGVEMGSDEFGDGTAEDNAKSFWIDAPAHDAERIRPKMFPAILDLRRASIARAQDDRGSAVAEQAGGNNVGLGQFVVAKSERAELDGHEQYIGARPRLRKTRGNR